MRVTETLMQEHRVIEQVLKCVSAMATRVDESGFLDIDSAERALTFLRTFADSCHHAKEERVLFPALARVGFTSNAGPVAVMLKEHELGREYLRRMEAAVARWRTVGRDAGKEFARTACDYVALLSQHISKEDHILFPLADHALVGAAADAVRESFESAEAEHGRDGVHAEMIAVADALGQRFGIRRAAVPSAFSGCCDTAMPG
jgi:hemerythrin-like domain-containing protein